MTTQISTDHTSVDANVALMRTIFEDIADGNPLRYVEALDDDVTMTITGEFSWSRTFTGKESVLRDLYGYVGSKIAGPNRSHPHHFIGGGDWVVIETRGDNTLHDGTPYRNHYCILYRLDAGRIVEIREYQDSAMVEQVLGPYPSTDDAA